MILMIQMPGLLLKQLFDIFEIKIVALGLIYMLELKQNEMDINNQNRELFYIIIINKQTKTVINKANIVNTNN